jgi:hypothetical protein
MVMTLREALGLAAFFVAVVLVAFWLGAYGG